MASEVFGTRTRRTDPPARQLAIMAGEHLHGHSHGSDVAPFRAFHGPHRGSGERFLVVVFKVVSFTRARRLPCSGPERRRATAGGPSERATPTTICGTLTASSPLWHRPHRSEQCRVSDGHPRLPRRSPKPMKHRPVIWSKRRRTAGRLIRPLAPLMITTNSANQAIPSMLWMSAMMIDANSGLTPLGTNCGEDRQVEDADLRVEQVGQQPRAERGARPRPAGRRFKCVGRPTAGGPQCSDAEPAQVRRASPTHHIVGEVRGGQNRGDAQPAGDGPQEAAEIDAGTGGESGLSAAHSSDTQHQHGVRARGYRY
jgi:hypothetical protein